MLTIHSIRETHPADDALAYALDRFLPNAERHELDYVRERLRERGHDVLAVIREVR